jgi:6-phosphogluconolactonase
MELVGAPVNELKPLITQSFEEWSRLRHGSGAAGPASCALSGGATALIFLGALRSADVDWRNIILFWADERAVPPDDPDSNYGLAERMLLSPLAARAPRAIRMPADTPDLAAAARWYDDALVKELDNDPLDLAILGIGEDGHIASLFPGHPALTQNDLRAVAIEDAPKPPRRRLSLTMRYLLQTKKIWVVAVGSRKLPVLQGALDKSSNSTPLDLLVRHATDVTVFTDQTIRRR